MSTNWMGDAILWSLSMGCDQDLHPELTSAGHAWRLTVVVTTAIDFVSDQNRSAVLQSPRNSRVREFAVFGIAAVWIGLFRSGCSGNLPGGRKSSTSLWLFPLFWFSLSLCLAFVFRLFGVGFVQPFGRILLDLFL